MGDEEKIGIWDMMGKMKGIWDMNGPVSPPPSTVHTYPRNKVTALGRIRCTADLQKRKIKKF